MTVFTATNRMRTDVSCDRITDVVRVGTSIICETYWREGGKPENGSRVAAMARTHVRHNERMRHSYTHTDVLADGIRKRTTVYVVNYNTEGN